MKIRGEPPTLYLTRPHKGPIAVHYTAHGIVVQKWPRRRPQYAKNPITAAQVATWDQVQEWVRSPEASELDQAYKDQTATAFYARDALVCAAYGNYVAWPGYGWQEVANMNIQELLNSLTTVEGSLILRASAAWVGLPPGNSGDVLTTTGGTPPVSWEPPAGSSGAFGLISTQDLTNVADIRWTGLTAGAYLLLIHQVIPVGTTRIALQIGTGGGPTWYSGSYAYGTTNATTGWDLCNGTNIVGSSTGRIMGSLRLSMDASKDAPTMDTTLMRYTGSATASYALSGWTNATGAAITALRLIALSGNIAGRASLYSITT